MGVLDLSHLLSEEAKRRQESKMKSAFKYFADPNVVFLGGGLPLSDYFPWDKVVATSPSVPFKNGIGAKPTADDATVVEITKEPTNDLDIPLKTSLQYGHTVGHPKLRAFLEEHTRMIHNPPNDDWEVILTIGNTQAWDACLRTFCNPGDVILVEQFTFPAALEAANSLAVRYEPMAMDDFGIIPEKLEEQMASWEGAKPKMIYTIPTGQNPTGSCLSAERRAAILKVASKYDMIVIEDEPYYFLQMEEYVEDLEKRKTVGVHSHEEFRQNLVKSMLSMDTEGRVIRLDSFSKVLAPGTRFGWMTGQKALMERFVRLHEVSVQGVSGFSQSLVLGTLSRWGQSGYLDWLIGMRHEYTSKRDVAIDALNKYFPKEVTSFVAPTAGMFFTFHLDASKHPKFATEFGSDPIKVESAVMQRSIDVGSLMMPGSWFCVGEVHSNTIFFRGTYAAVASDKVEEGVKRFGQAVREEFGL